MHWAIDLAYLNSAVIADKCSTYFGVKKYGAKAETNIEERKSMEKEGQENISSSPVSIVCPHVASRLESFIL